MNKPFNCQPPVCSKSPARWIGELDESEFEIQFYQQILEKQPNDVLVLRQLGEQLAKTGKVAKTLELDLRLVKLRPRDEVARYNLACSLAKMGQCDQAIAELAVSLELGYADWEHIESDVDLDNLRGLGGFRRLLTSWKKTLPRS
ncbi:MAG: hypothetical protein SFX18_04465 [Pirellulales bacterium]|nr:hypothetical protein [Pirellulales bacterium]